MNSPPQNFNTHLIYFFCSPITGFAVSRPCWDTAVLRRRARSRDLWLWQVLLKTLPELVLDAKHFIDLSSMPIYQKFNVRYIYSFHFLFLLLLFSSFCQAIILSLHSLHESTDHSRYERKEKDSIYFGIPDVPPSKSLFPKRQLFCWGAGQQFIHLHIQVVFSVLGSQSSIKV